MAYVNFNEVGITSANLDEFYEVVRKFGKKRGTQAAERWLFKLNPLAQDHHSVELNYMTGDGYTRRVANEVVRHEYSHAPLPVRCWSCEEGVAWYKATFGAHRCTSCGSLNLHAEHVYLDDLLGV
jgi:predicted Zn-dependent protease